MRERERERERGQLIVHIVSLQKTEEIFIGENSFPIQTVVLSHLKL